MKREFVQLAHNFNEKKYTIAGWFMSEKLDGMRAIWDGGITRGMPSDEVPFANTEKDFRYVNRQYATGLWSRYGKPIQAPDWFLNMLPPIPLDGELYVGLGSFQELTSIIKQLTPDERWRKVKYMVFDSPPYALLFGDGHINNTNFKKTFSGILNWLKTKTNNTAAVCFDFERTYNYLSKNITENSNLMLHQQDQLAFNTDKANQEINDKLFEVTRAGGEGLMLRRPVSVWTPERSHNLLKVKRMLDAEGTIIGYNWGKETDKGSKLLGLMGSAIISFNGRTFELSGFTEEERVMDYANGPGNKDQVKEIGAMNPGRQALDEFHNPMFPRGSKITFKYRELTDSGIPKEARYYRKS